MDVTIRIPSLLRQYTEMQSEIELKGNTVAAVLENFKVRFQDASNRFFSPKTAHYMNLYLNDQNIRTLNNHFMKTMCFPSFLQLLAANTPFNNKTGGVPHVYLLFIHIGRLIIEKFNNRGQTPFIEFFQKTGKRVGRPPGYAG